MNLKVIKITAFAIILNLLFGGLGYLYIGAKSRIPLAIFLIFITAYEFIRDVVVIFNPAMYGDPYAIHILPLPQLLTSIPGVILFVAMAVDIYFLVRRQGKLRRVVPQGAA